MKKILFCMLVMLTALCLSTRAEATLFNRGVDDNNGNRLIYDDDLDITWYDFSNARDTRDNQVSWAAGLTVTFNTTDYSDWRLPTTPGTQGGYTNEGEMGHLYYDELDIDGGGSLNNPGNFQKLLASVYWSGTEVDSISAWYFNFDNGFQGTDVKFIGYYGLAVRSGDVAPVPEPATVALLGIGIAGMAGAEARRRRKKKAVDKG